MAIPHSYKHIQTSVNKLFFFSISYSVTDFETKYKTLLTKLFQEVQWLAWKCNFRN